jgi:hypothetical protein
VRTRSSPAGLDPADYTPQPPRPGRFGAVVTVEGRNGERVDAIALRITDELVGGEYDVPDANRRYVGITFQLRNAGTATFNDFPSAKLVLADGRALEPAILLGGSCSSDDFSSVELAVGDTVRACVPFEVPYDARIRAFQLRIGSSNFVARWRVTPSTTVENDPAYG